MRFLQLGASLYVPATRDGLVMIANGEKYPQLRSVIFCTEDAIEARELPQALANVQTMLRCLERGPLLRFVRARNVEVLRELLRMDGVNRLDGFVLPKVTRHNVGLYLEELKDRRPFDVMLTLESLEAFDPVEMAGLRDLLLAHPLRDRVLSLRIGGNDLFNLLGLRRPRGRLVYDTPLAVTIAQLVTTFRPHGFNLTAPVFEYLDQPDTLAREAREDLVRGLFGKTAIHPHQVEMIESQYRVTAEDLKAAEQVLKPSAPPVFRLDGAMCEPATHRRWATLVRERARLYGLA